MKSVQLIWCNASMILWFVLVPCAALVVSLVLFRLRPVFSLTTGDLGFCGRSFFHYIRVVEGGCIEKTLRKTRGKPRKKCFPSL